MLWVVSHWPASPDLDFYLCDREISLLVGGNSIGGNVIITTQQERWAKKLVFVLDTDIHKFRFSESNQELSVWISSEDMWEFLSGTPLSKWLLAERCDYWEGSKITMKSLKLLWWEMLEWFSLVTAWMHLARQDQLPQSEELWIVQWLFSGITEQERRIIVDIFDC